MNPELVKELNENTVNLLIPCEIENDETIDEYAKRAAYEIKRHRPNLDINQIRQFVEAIVLAAEINQKILKVLENEKSFTQ